MVMTSNIHFGDATLNKNAAKSINVKGVELLKFAIKKPFEKFTSDPFPTRRETDDIIGEKDVLGEPTLSYTDMTGRTVARYFTLDRYEIGLFDHGYENLRRLVEQVGKTKPLNKGFSSEFIEKTIFEWWRANYGSSSPSSLSDHLMLQASMAYGEHHLAIPISAVEIERPFRIGDVLVAPMDKQMLWETSEPAVKRNPEHAARIEEASAALVRELGHLTCVHVNILGEANFAKDMATQTAFQITEMFRFMSPAAVSWNVAYPCFPHGCHYHRTTTALTIANDKITHLTQSMLEYGMFSRKITFAELDRDMKSGFANFSVFFQNGILSPFEFRVGKAIGAFAEGVATHDVNNRLIYVMSSLEHLFLREQEPIQNGVGERIAFLIERDAKKRRDILANFKKSYALRSKRIHHLSTVDDEHTLSEFFKNAWIAVYRALESMPQYKTPADFLDAIDNVKFGGGQG